MMNNYTEIDIYCPRCGRNNPKVFNRPWPLKAMAICQTCDNHFGTFNIEGQPNDQTPQYIRTKFIKVLDGAFPCIFDLWGITYKNLHRIEALMYNGAEMVKIYFPSETKAILLFHEGYIDVTVALKSQSFSIVIDMGAEKPHLKAINFINSHVIKTKYHKND